MDIKRAWMTAVLKAHGHKPTFTDIANLSQQSRVVLDAVDLHYHDLGREPGSRWLERGVDLHTVRDWLGHTSIEQTSTYLAGTVYSGDIGNSLFRAASKTFIPRPRKALRA